MLITLIFLFFFTFFSILVLFSLFISSWLFIEICCISHVSFSPFHLLTCQACHDFVDSELRSPMAKVKCSDAAGTTNF